MPTHGSLSKAGKTRSLTGLKKDMSKLGFNPRIKNKRKYNNRIILQRNTTEKGLKAANINPVNGGIEGDEEDDSWGVQVPFCVLRLSRMIRDSELCLDEV